jgi:hypothetical protein
MPRQFAFILIFLMVLQTAQAESPTTAILQAQHASWPDGLARAESFDVFRIRQTESTSPQLTKPVPLAAGGFQLRAVALDVETDVSDLQTGPGSSGTLPYTEKSHFTTVDAKGTEAREGQFLYAFPTSPGSVSAQISCGSSAASALNTVQAPSKVGARQPIVADTSDALQVDPCDGAELVLRGDFLLVLWERDVHLTAAEGEADFSSGLGGQNAVGIDARPFIGKAKEIYFVARGAEFRIIADQTQGPALFAAALALDGASRIALEGADGQVSAGLQDVHGQSIELVGVLRGGLQRAGSNVEIQVRDGLDAVSVDGHDVPLTTAEVAAGPSWSWIAFGIVGMVGLVAVPVLVPRARIVRRHRVDSLLYRCDRLFEAGKYEAMHDLAQEVLRVAPQRAEAHVQVARALEACGYDGLAFRRRADELYAAAGNVARRAENKLQAADAIVERDGVAALQLLHEAIELDPSLWGEAMRSPPLAALLDRYDYA